MPLFLTQGLTENNTVADGTAQYLQNHQGYERAWLGPWEHVRGNERDENGRLKMGREGWFDEVMRFYDRFLKGDTPSVTDPQFAVQTNDGKWRAEDQWPPADAVNYTSACVPAATTTTERARRPATTPQACGRSRRACSTTPTWPGSGKAIVDVATTRPNANLVVDVYDLDEYGIGPLVTRQGFLVRSSGEKTLDLWSADWKFPAGHRIARAGHGRERGLVGAHAAVRHRQGGRRLRDAALPHIHAPDTIQGDPGTQLEGYMNDTETVPPETMRDSVDPAFNLPPAQQPRPSG